MTTTNRQWVLRRHPIGELAPGDMELVETPIPELSDGQVLVRNVYLSLDPSNRIVMSGQGSYITPVAPGQVMWGKTLGVVEASRSAKFREGETVYVGGSGWQSHSVVGEDGATPVRRVNGIGLDAHLHVLGTTGMTAYFGLADIGRPKPGETVVVSAAAGAVGSLVGQLAKRAGARVIGIAGGPQKCRWIVDDLGFDAAIDYRNEDVAEALDRLCPAGIDVDFENVGGEIMKAVISRMNVHGRVALCGLISTYNQPGPATGPEDFTLVLLRRLLIQGFILVDYMPRASEALEVLTPLVATGALQWKTDIVEGLESAPTAMGRMFSGAHDGKLLVRVSPEP